MLQLKCTAAVRNWELPPLLLEKTKKQPKTKLPERFNIFHCFTKYCSLLGVMQETEGNADGGGAFDFSAVCGKASFMF